MPEGPEIRREADRIAEALVGERLERVRFGLPRLRHHGKGLKGAKVESVTSRGKALLTRFEGGPVLYSHNQLYGKWVVCAAGKPPATNRSLRVALEGPERWALLYSASEIEVLPEEDLAEHPYLAKLGPDLLDQATTPARIRKRLDQKAFRNRSLGALLLDQGFLAGVGNYLRSEILFFAGLRPDHRPADLDDDEKARLAKAAREVTRRSNKTGGLTEEPAVVKAGKAAGLRRGQLRFAVFSRAGTACRRCERRVIRQEVAGRRLYLCPDCQV